MGRGASTVISKTESLHAHNQSFAVFSPLNLPGSTILGEQVKGVYVRSRVEREPTHLSALRQYLQIDGRDKPVLLIAH